MAGKQVVRVEKLKGTGRIRRRIVHAMRDSNPRNADPARAASNTYFMPNEPIKDFMALAKGERSKLAIERWEKRLPEKYRSDAVTCAEAIVTMSHGALTPEETEKYLADGYAWLTKHFGGKDNVICGAVHRDETTTHLSVFYVPRIDDRLCFKSFVDGPASLAKLQTDFHENVSKQYGLERGREWSPARHTSIHEYYSIVNETVRALEEKREQERLAYREKKKTKDTEQEIER